MIRIVTDSVASIPADIAEELGIEVVSMYLNYKGREYVDATMDIDRFYRDIYGMIDDIPTSSQPSQTALESLFEDIASAGDELLGIFMSSEMSGTFESALRAARSVFSHHTNFRYRIIDSTSNSFDEAFSVFEAVVGREAGLDLEGCAKLSAHAIASTRFLFTPESLRFLKAGGRIGKASALLGTVMKICPIITVSDGESSTFAKVRTHKKALAAMAQKFKDDMMRFGFKDAVVHYIGSREEAALWAREVIDPLVGHSVRVIPVSPVIGLHVGPAVAIAYECREPLPGKLSSDPMTLVYAS